MKNYKLIKSDQYCCVGAALVTILNFYGIKQFTQYDIVNEFGINIPPSAVISPKVKNVSYSENPNDWEVNLNMNSIDYFFSKNNLYLKEEYISISKIPDYSFSNILSNISGDFHIIFGFDYGLLYNIKDLYKVGHVGIFLKIDQEKVEYLDPGPKSYGKHSIEEEELYFAIKSKMDGLWIIKELDST